MLRQERFGAGMADQKNLDAELAGAIMGDGKFEVSALLMRRIRLSLLNLIVARMTWNTWTIMLKNWGGRKCAQMR